jgi:hypothetical protein
MKILLGLAAAIVLLAAAVCWVGSRLPVRHRARMEVRVDAPPAAAFALVADVARAPTWRKDVASVELLAAENGMPGFRETGKRGTITYRIEAAEAPHRFVTRIADTGLGYGGRWTWDIRGDGSGSIVTITEDGEVDSPLFRFMSRYVFGHYASLQSYLQSLAATLGSSTPPRRLAD